MTCLSDNVGHFPLLLCLKYRHKHEQTSAGKEQRRPQTLLQGYDSRIDDNLHASLGVEEAHAIQVQTVETTDHLTLRLSDVPQHTITENQIIIWMKSGVAKAGVVAVAGVMGTQKRNKNKIQLRNVHTHRSAAYTGTCCSNILHSQLRSLTAVPATEQHTTQSAEIIDCSTSY